MLRLGIHRVKIKLAEEKLKSLNKMRVCIRFIGEPSNVVMKKRLRYIAMIAGSAVMLSSCAVYDYPVYTGASVSVGWHGWSSSVSWTNASYDANGFPIYGYYYGQPVYGYTAAGAAIFSIAAITAACLVPDWGPAPWYCGHWHYPRHVHRVCAPPRHPAGHHPGVRPSHHSHGHHVGVRPHVKPNRPHVQPNRPHAQPNRPHAQPNRPHAQPSRPHAQPSRPHVQPSRPHVQLNRPHVQPNRPHAQLNRPHSRPSRSPMMSRSNGSPRSHGGSRGGHGGRGGHRR